MLYCVCRVTLKCFYQSNLDFISIMDSSGVLSRQRRYWWNDQIRNLRFSLSCVSKLVSHKNPTLHQYFFLCPHLPQLWVFFHFLTQLMGAFPLNRNLGTLFWSDISAIQRFVPTVQFLIWDCWNHVWLFNRPGFVSPALIWSIVVEFGWIRPILGPWENIFEREWRW